jgi:sialic acid synthase SpsE
MTYIIAEIGINHNGDLETAKRLIDVAAASGCDAVKFQKRNPDVCVPEHQKGIMRETPWGCMTYLEYKYRVEFGKKEYDEIDRYCRTKEIEWSASPWDIDSLNFLKEYDLPWIKVPSAMLTNVELLTAALETEKKLIISTGMSTKLEIQHTVDYIVKRNPNIELVLLHCNSTYPAPLKELNLKCIQTLKEDYPFAEIGYSGHEFRLGTTVSSIYLGATYLERHITLDRTMWGSDHLSSVEPQGLFKLVKGVRELELALGDGQIQVYDGEKAARLKLRGY